MTSSLLQVVSNSLWFAFDALDQHKTGVVDKTRLKELTRQVGDALCVERAVENCLVDYRSTDTLTFDQYLHFLEYEVCYLEYEVCYLEYEVCYLEYEVCYLEYEVCYLEYEVCYLEYEVCYLEYEVCYLEYEVCFFEYEVFSDVCSASTPYCSVERHHAALDALFWEVGRHSLGPRYPAVLSPADTYKVFRVFSLLADRIPLGGDLLQVTLQRCEVCEVSRHLVEGLGRDWDWADWQMMSGSISTFPLPVFLTFLEGRYGENTEASALSEAVDSLYRVFVGQAIFQGRAYQRITRAGGWLRRDIEVTPWCIRASGELAEDVTDDAKSVQVSPGKLTAAVGRSLTLGRNAVGAVGGAMRTGVTEVVERSRTLTRSSPSPSTKSEHKTNGAKRGLSMGRWGSASGLSTKKRNDQKDSASLGGRESPSPHVETRRSLTLDRATLRNSKNTAALGGSPSSSRTVGGKTLSPRLVPKESTKGIIGGVIGRVWKLDITPETTVTSLKDTNSGKPCKISIVNTPTARPIVLAAQDHKSKARLLAALQEAINHCTDALPYQLCVSLARREEEVQEERRACEERIRRSSQADIIEQTQAELAAERTAREEAESLAQSEAVARAAEEERVVELTTLRQQLEALLQQETQAKKDEEIVRNLQARVLREEWAKREELERLQQEQQQLLEEEQRKRRAFEILQKEQEKKLREAESRLKSLDGDRRRLDEELRAAREKIVMSGRGKQLLEAKMKVQEGRRPPQRTLSLRPSRQERASPARSSSFTTSPHRTLLPSPTSGDSKLPGAVTSQLASTTPSGDSPQESVFTPRGSLYPRRVQTPGPSASSTPATSPSGALANRTILDYLEGGCMNGTSGGSPSGSSSNIKSIPEQKSEEEDVPQTVGWNIPDTEEVNGLSETSETKPAEPVTEKSEEDTLKVPKVSVIAEVNSSDSETVENFYADGKKYIEIKTYEEKSPPEDSNSTTVTKTTVVSDGVLDLDPPGSSSGSMQVLEADGADCEAGPLNGSSYTVVTKTTTVKSDGAGEVTVTNETKESTSTEADAVN
ncbi:hypothetical protein FHG87_013477 [Trinorchestia longiramus]|nr:hypothetical protein FHG87_013477 [Trinorchestia longiramus]